MALNSNREKERQAKLKSNRSDSKTFKMEDGPNVIRVLKFKHKVTKADVEAKLYGKSEVGTTAEEWCFPFTVQYGLLAENRKIPVAATEESLALWRELRKSTDPKDVKTARDIQPKNAFAMNIIDIDDPNAGVQTYLAPKTVREFIGKYVVDPDFGEAVLGVKGRDFKIEYNSKADNPKDYYPASMLMDKEKSRPINSKVEAQVKDFYDPEVNADFTGRVAEEDALSLPTGSKAEAPTEDLEGKDEAPAKAKGKKKETVKEANDDIFDAD